MTAVSYTHLDVYTRQELRELTDSSIAKLRGMSDAEYGALDLFPDFEKEDMDAE